ncbi:hypothetical protein [Prevotella sp.]|uniref:hypothetical protein n=1 Tax=Prevotella sp. TaxID=59823 RepID=UPI003DA469D5
MKNLLYIAAIAATAVGFTSCSSNEDLNDAVKDSGVPFKVTASAPTTRATDLTSSNFTNFQLYAFEGTDEWITGKQFTKSTSWSPASGTYKWPTAATPSNFYGVSENAASMSSAFVDDIANSKSFTYTVPTTIADQKDLLVASTTGKSNDTQVSLPFNHALASATLKITLDPSVTNYKSEDGGRLFIKIKSITIHNIEVSGIYSFTNSSWTLNGTHGNYIIDLSASPIVIDTDNNTSASLSDATVNVSGSMMFVPQTITCWNIFAHNGDDVSTEPDNKSFISFEAQAVEYNINDVISCCDAAVTKGDCTSDANYYYVGATKIATKEGKILDWTNSIFSKSDQDYIPFTVQYETYSHEQQKLLLGNVNELATAGYGTLYKPIRGAYNSTDKTYSNLVLDATKAHVFNVNIANAVRKEDGDGAFGSPVHVQN